MMRISLNSSVFAIVGLLASAGAVGLGAQGRPRGTAPAQGQAVPRTGTEGGERSRAQAPQAQGPRSGPSFGAAPPSVPPTRRVEVPNAAAQPRPAPPAMPPAVVPQIVQPQVVQPQFARPQGGTLRSNDHPDYRPDYRPYYRPDYRPQYQSSYRQLYRPDYRRSYRPYYTFRPRVRLGFGLWIGYPVTYPTYFYPATPYPYAYSSPYPNAYPYPTGIYPPPVTTAAVGAAGGLSFDISPAEAGVYVDGYYMGPVAQFTPNQPPLALAPGRHHIEIREPGFEIIAFDVDILPGQVIPYQGDLRRF